MEKGNLMMIVIIVLLLALLATVIGVTFFALSTLGNIQQEQHLAGFDTTPRALAANEIDRVLIGDSIITNVANETTGRTSTASIRVVIGFDNTQESESAAISELINQQTIFIRSVALERIRSRTYQELAAPGGMESISAELLEIFQNEFRTTMIVSVDFYEWILMM
ncbi:MAG: flagellar basal body-associated FliL family protein [Defluviitaleaceae bacterium]|nr:flagellar basal body-associated FliL family protein [Defluviitaleaceae bacterium]